MSTDYYRKRGERAMTELFKNHSIVLNWLIKNNAPQKVIDAFNKGKRTSVMLI